MQQMKSVYNNKESKVKMPESVSPLAIILIIIMPAICMYNIDWPQALATPLQLAPYSLTLQQISLFYTIPQIICMLFAFKIGIIFDGIQLRKLLLVFPTIVLFFQIATALSFYGNYANNYICIMIFRVLSIVLAQYTFILQAMTFGKILKQKASYYKGYGEIIPATFGSVNSLITPIIFNATNQVYICLLVGAGFGLLSVIVCWIICYLYYQKLISKESSDKIQQPAIQIVQTSGQNLDKTIISPPIKQQQQLNSISLIDQIKLFTKPFWLIQLMVFAFYCNTLVFVSNLNDTIVKRFGIQYADSGKLSMVPFLSAAAFSVIWYPIIKKFPHSRRIIFLTISIFLLTAQLYYYLLPNTATSTPLQFGSIIIICIFTGFGYSGVAMILIPTIYYLVKQKEQGAAFSLIEMQLSIGYTIIPSIFAKISSSYPSQAEGYNQASIIFMLLGIFGLLLALYVAISKDFQVFDVASNNADISN